MEVVMNRKNSLQFLQFLGYGLFLLLGIVKEEFWYTPNQDKPFLKARRSSFYTAFCTNNQALN